MSFSVYTTSMGFDTNVYSWFLSYLLFVFIVRTFGALIVFLFF